MFKYSEVCLTVRRSESTCVPFPEISPDQFEAVAPVYQGPTLVVAEKRCAVIVHKCLATRT
jgi:hypothetical protein